MDSSQVGMYISMGSNGAAPAWEDTELAQNVFILYY